MIDDEGMAMNTTPKTFTEKIKWMDWKVKLINLLKFHPGRNGVTLNHFVRDNVNPIISNKPNFLDDYSNITPL